MNNKNIEYVDLGLSVSWAKCNFEANTPKEYGTFLSIQEELQFEEDNVRVPTMEDWRQLIENCDIECTFKFKLDSPEFPREKYGYIFTSKINGRQIFLPCAGVKGEIKNIFPSAVDAKESYEAAALYLTSSLKDGIPIYFVMETSFPTNWCGGGYVEFEPTFSDDFEGLEALPLRLVKSKTSSIIWDVTNY